MANVKLRDKPIDRAGADLHHKASNCHVLVLEADLPDHLRNELITLSESGRCFSNHLRHIFIGRLKDLFRTRAYRALLLEYRELRKSDQDDSKEKLKAVVEKLNAMQVLYHLTMADVVSEQKKLYRRYGLPSVFALTLAEDVWSGIEKVLYSDGRNLHYLPKGRLVSLRAKQFNKIILLKVKDGDLVFSYNRKEFGYVHRKNDRFEQEEVAAVVNWIENCDRIEHEAGLDYLFYKKKTDTHRPCFATLVFKEIRGKIRVYIHITVEGPAFPKKRKNGSPRHVFGKGIVGCDIGTQSIAYVAPDDLGLKNLAERGPSIRENERKQKLLARKMDRSRRAMNPDNFNEDGTVRKGRKAWKESNRYKRLKVRYRDLCRKNAVNRKLAIRQDLNRLRSAGDVFITEPPNAKKLQKRSSKPAERQDQESTVIKKDGTEQRVRKFKRKKRFGKSILNRCPGYFQAEAKKKFPVYIEVPNDYRASQFDHTSCTYKKHKLSERMFALSDGSVVQRDLYSAFLLAHYQSWGEYAFPDADGCRDDFPWFKHLSDEIIGYFKDNQIDIKNSGIRI